MNCLKNLFLGRPTLNYIHTIKTLSYKSNLALENLYPNSSLTLKTIVKPETKLCDKFSGYIPIDQLEISYSKSSGPGGQNVNKVNTKVDLRFKVETASWLDSSIKAKLSQTQRSRINSDGYLIVRSDSTRSQQLNLADCLSKLRNYIYEASYEPPTPSEESLEKARRRHEKEARERLRLKRERSLTKQSRQDPNIRDLD